MNRTLTDTMCLILCHRKERYLQVSFTLSPCFSQTTFPVYFGGCGGDDVAVVVVLGGFFYILVLGKEVHFVVKFILAFHG